MGVARSLHEKQVVLWGTIGKLNTLFKGPVKSPDAQAGTDRVLLILKVKVPYNGVEPTACA